LPGSRFGKHEKERNGSSIKKKKNSEHGGSRSTSEPGPCHTCTQQRGGVSEQGEKEVTAATLFTILQLFQQLNKHKTRKGGGEGGSKNAIPDQFSRGCLAHSGPPNPDGSTRPSGGKPPSEKVWKKRAEKKWFSMRLLCKGGKTKKEPRQNRENKPEHKKNKKKKARSRNLQYAAFWSGMGKKIRGRMCRKKGGGGKRNERRIVSPGNRTHRNPLKGGGIEAREKSSLQKT